MTSKTLTSFIVIALMFVLPGSGSSDTPSPVITGTITEVESRTGDWDGDTDVGPISGQFLWCSLKIAVTQPKQFVGRPIEIEHGKPGQDVLCVKLLRGREKGQTVRLRLNDKRMTELATDNVRVKVTPVEVEWLP